MLRKRSLGALFMAGLLSLGTIGVALADDSGADFVPVPQGSSIQDDSGADFAPAIQNTDTQITVAGLWA